MKKFSQLVVLLVVAAVFLAACSPKTAQPTVESANAQPALLIAEGRLLPVNSMEQSFSRPNQVAEIFVKNGDEVKAGQVLARLHGSSELQAALVRAQQEALLARQALDELESAAEVNLTQGRLAVIAAQEQVEAAQERYDADKTDENKAALEAAEALLKQAEAAQAKLEAGAGVDPDQRAAAEARLTSANAAVASAQAAVDALELKATMNGVLVDATLQVGEWVAAGQPVFTLADFSGWVVKTDDLTEAEVVDVAVGQKAQIILDALPEVTLMGEVTQINSRYEEKRGDITYTVTIALDETDPRMRWGMTAAVQFVR